MIIISQIFETKKYRYLSIYIQSGEEIESYRPSHFNEEGEMVADQAWKGVFVRTPYKTGEDRPVWCFRGYKYYNCSDVIERLRKSLDFEKDIYYLGSFPHRIEGDEIR